MNAAKRPRKKMKIRNKYHQYEEVLLVFRELALFIEWSLLSQVALTGACEFSKIKISDAFFLERMIQKVIKTMFSLGEKIIATFQNMPVSLPKRGLTAVEAYAVDAPLSCRGHVMSQMLARHLSSRGSQSYFSMKHFSKSLIFSVIIFSVFIQSLCLTASIIYIVSI